MRIFWIFLSIVLLVFAGSFTWYYWPLHIDIAPPFISQTIATTETGTRIYVPNRTLVGELAHFDDALFAFLMYDYMRGQPLLEKRQLLLTAREQNQQTIYSIQVRLPDDLISGLCLLAELRSSKFTSNLRYVWLLPQQLKSAFDETSLFVKAYGGPAGRRLKDDHAPELEAYLRRFIRFKSTTDPRASQLLDPIPSPLTSQDASRLAADMVAVARFYDIPIYMFLGIGAMENNYMNVAGDLENTAWKRHPDPGDIVIRRRRGRVLVRNDSMGVWQITRQSLRYAHKLFLKDQRDYSLLPERLHPPRKLDITDVSSDVLTTYAGLLLRDLLDRFKGDVTLAVGAYNGGPANPNLQYAEGVALVADYAQRVIGRAAAMDRIALESKSVDQKRITESPAQVAANQSVAAAP